jgi:hypothetical protein
MADRLTKTVALPHDLQLMVTDKTPKDIDVATAETDGSRIWWPAAFSKTTHDVLTEFLPEIVASKGPPKAISHENFTPDGLTCGAVSSSSATSWVILLSISSTSHSRAWKKIPPTASRPSSLSTTRTLGQTLPSGRPSL